jgi:hypothetical protein
MTRRLIGGSVSIYLAGAIRSTPYADEYDRAWRNYVTAHMHKKYALEDVTVLNPMYGKELKDDKKWTIYGEFDATEGNFILQHDIAAIKRADILLMNLLPFDKQSSEYSFTMPDGKVVTGFVPASENGYSLIGSIAELGMGLITNKLIVAIVDHPWLDWHPFINGVTRKVRTVEGGLAFTNGLIESQLGYV